MSAPPHERSRRHSFEHEAQHHQQQSAPILFTPAQHGAPHQQQLPQQQHASHFPSATDPFSSSSSSHVATTGPLHFEPHNQRGTPQVAPLHAQAQAGFAAFHAHQQHQPQHGSSWASSSSSSDNTPTWTPHTQAHLPSWQAPHAQSASPLQISPPHGQSPFQSPVSSRDGGLESPAPTVAAGALARGPQHLLQTRGGAGAAGAASATAASVASRPTFYAARSHRVPGATREWPSAIQTHHNPNNHSQHQQQLSSNGEEPPSPYSSHENKKREYATGRSSCWWGMLNRCAHSTLALRIRGWWAVQGDAMRAFVLAVLISLALAALVLSAYALSGTAIGMFGLGRSSMQDARQPFSQLQEQQQSLSATSLVLSTAPTSAGRLGAAAAQLFERPPSLRGRKDRHLGEFSAGGAGGRAPPPEPLPYVTEDCHSAPSGAACLADTPATLTHAPLTSSLLSRAAFGEYLQSERKSLAVERTKDPSNAGKGWMENPWGSAFSTAAASSASPTASQSKRELASITLFAVFPDLNLLKTAPSPASSVAAEQDALALHLLALSSWVELVPPEKVHIFVNSAETCLQLVGHDGSPLAQGVAIATAERERLSGGTGNPLARVHCHIFPCTHPRFKRGLMSCVWNDMSSRTAAELQARKDFLRKERMGQLQLLRSTKRASATPGAGAAPLLDAEGRPLVWTQERESELVSALASVDLEEEILMYLSPSVLFDLQLLTSLTVLAEESLAVRRIIQAAEIEARHHRGEDGSASDVSSSFPSLGLDINGLPRRDTGHWMAVGRRTDVEVGQHVLGMLRPSPSTAAGQDGAQGEEAQLRAVSGLFHSPTASFLNAQIDALESVWTTAYQVPSASSSGGAAGGAVLHSGFGIDFFAMQVGSYIALEQHHLSRAAREASRAEEEGEESLAGIPPPVPGSDAAVEALLKRAGVKASSSGLPLAESMQLLGEALSLPARTLPPASSSSDSSSSSVSSSSDSFFPPFLSGLFRWQNWMLTRWVLLEGQPFHARTIDLSSSVTLVHLAPPASVTHTLAQLQAPGVSQLAQEGARFNEALVRSLTDNAYRIGSIDSSSHLTVGSCLLPRIRRGGVNEAPKEPAMSPSLLPPRCEIHPRPPGNFSNVYYFTRHASRGPNIPNDYIIVLTVNSGYMQLALNWLCWARRVSFTSYLLLAEDQRSARVFRALGAPVIVPPDASDDLPPADYGSVAFQRTMSFRTEFLLQVLLAGFHFVTADMDALWMGDPVAYFPESADLSGQPHKGTKLSGGFIVVRSTSSGRLFWHRVVECQRMNAGFLATHAEGTYEPSLYTEQYCINELSLALEKKSAESISLALASGHPAPPPLFTKTLLDPLQFPDGKAFFDELRSQLANVAPIVIHNNWIMGTGGKFGRMVDWGMVSIAGKNEKGTDGYERALALGAKDLSRNEPPKRAPEVCAPLPPLPRVVIPRSVPSPTGGQGAAPVAHPFHLHVRLFLSPAASDGLEQQGEFDNLRRTLRSLIDADYSSVSLPDDEGDSASSGSAVITRKVVPHLHVEVMLDHWQHSQSSPARAGEVAEFERLKSELKNLRDQWVAKFGDPASNGGRFVLEVKRPRSKAGDSSQQQQQPKRVGPLGLWAMPWPSMAVEGAEGLGVGASSGAAAGEGHHDASLYLNDDVHLSPQWFTWTHALLRTYAFPSVSSSPSPSAPTPDPSSSPGPDPRIYGFPLLDALEIWGETRSQNYSSSSEYVESLIRNQPYFSRSSGTWGRVKQRARRLALRVREASQGGKPSSAPLSPAEFRAQLPSSFLATRPFGFQGLSQKQTGCFLWRAGHFDDWVRWLAQQGVEDTLRSEAVAPLAPPPNVDGSPAPAPAAATKCVPGLASNLRIMSSPPEITWFEWVNRWAYERGYYTLQTRTVSVSVSGASPAELRSIASAPKGSTAPLPPLRAREYPTRLAVALTPDQAVEGSPVSLLTRFDAGWDTLFPPPSSSADDIPVYDFALSLVPKPVTLAYRSLLSPVRLLESCYVVSTGLQGRLAQLAERDAAALEAQRALKRAAKAAKDAAKKAAADAAALALGRSKAKADADKKEKAAAAAKAKKVAADAEKKKKDKASKASKEKEDAAKKKKDKEKVKAKAKPAEEEE